VCPEFSGKQFDALVRDVSRIAFTDGLSGLEKEVRLKFFERHYHVKGQASKQTCHLQ
jgi:phage regulator Rha-like protein